MKYSEVKEKVLFAKRLGFFKVPKLGMWFKQWDFPGDYHARFTITNTELAYTPEDTIREQCSWLYEKWREEARTKLMCR